MDGTRLSALLDLESLLSDPLARASAEVQKGITLPCLAALAIASGIDFCKTTLAPAQAVAAKYLTPYLRQMSEQLITLDYLGRQQADDVRELLPLLYYRDLSRLVLGQNSFFARRRPAQPLVELDPVKLFDAARRRQLKDVGRRFTPPAEKGLPPTEQMAADCKYPDLYDHIYRMTSKTVHFSILDLLQSTWGDDGAMGHSPKHFELYYRAVNNFYGPYLLAAMCARLSPLFVPEVDLDGVRVRVDALVSGLREVFRWPEAVTYEETNRPVPGEIIYMLTAASSKEVSWPPPELIWAK